MLLDSQNIIQQTQNWIDKFVIDLNLCPFASSPFRSNNIEYIVNFEGSIENHLQQLADCFIKLDTDSTLETSFLIFSNSYHSFSDYLDLLDLANHLLKDLDYEGTYQIASFHPNYQFEESEKNDASNFSNRSPYPMLHLLRESSLEKAIDNYSNTKQISEKNIQTLRNIGFQKLNKQLNNIINNQ